MVVVENGVATLNIFSADTYGYMQSGANLKLVTSYGIIDVASASTIAFKDKSYVLASFKSSFLEVPESTIVNAPNTELLVGTEGADNFFTIFYGEVVDGLDGVDTLVTNVRLDQVGEFYRNDDHVVIDGVVYRNIEKFQFEDVVINNAELEVNLQHVNTRNQTITGTNQDDRLMGGLGNDVVDGGLGNDTAVMNFHSSLISGYAKSGSTIKFDVAWGYEFDTYINVEVFEFDDVTYSIGELDSAFSSLSAANQVIDFSSQLNTNIIVGSAGEDAVVFDVPTTAVKGYSGGKYVSLDFNSNIRTFDDHDFIGIEYFRFTDRTVAYEELSEVFASVEYSSFHVESSFTDLVGGAGDDHLTGNRVFGASGNDTLIAINEDSFLFGGAGNDSIYAGGKSDYVNAGAGDDAIYTVRVGDIVDGGAGNDFASLNFGANEITSATASENGKYSFTTSSGSIQLSNIESVSLNGADATSLGYLLANLNGGPKFSTVSGSIAPEQYLGDVAFLEYQLFGDQQNNVVTGDATNDFISLFGGTDAANGGAGQDVLDGGTGSNFLTGGMGADTFFLDGRGGTITWSTITDFAGDSVNIWGWNAGSSTLLLIENNAGADGFKGVTFHYDLNNDQTIDTSITFSGLQHSEMSVPSEEIIGDNGYLLFI